MTDTQKRITAYKKALPHMKERVTAVALLLAIAVAMMTSATFAWMTLSRSPEASSIWTTVTTNGNLEIALSGSDGAMPPETGINDGGRDITQTNLTWGNLINLSDISYGLKDIVLRPASLNPKTLATSPMYAVQYGTDGRVTGYLYDFLYANYVKDAESGKMYFATEDVIRYGVRAISTVTYEDVTGDAVMIRRIEEMQAALLNAKQSFKNIYDINNSSDAKEYMSAVGGLVGVHVDKTLNGGSPDASAHMTGLYNLSNAFLKCVVDMGDVLVQGANLCVFMSLVDRTEYDDKAFTFEDLAMGRMTNEAIEERCGGKYDVNFTAIEDFRTLWKKLAGADCVMQGVNDEWKPADENGVFVEGITLPGYSSNYASPTSNAKSIYGAYEVILAKYQNYRKRVMDGATDQTVPWDNWMIMAVNQMCDMDTATIRYQGGQDYTPDDLLALKSQATSFDWGAIGILSNFMGNGPFFATINDGAIQDVGQLLGEGMYVPSNDAIRVKAAVKVSSLNLDIDMKPSISTTVDPDGVMLATDVEEVKRIASGGSNYRGDPVAAETYAMVFDFWVRTNAEDTLLTLEGDLIYNQKTGTDSSGRKLGLLFSYKEDDPATGTWITRYVYQHQDKYYFDYEQEGINTQLTAQQVAAIKETLEPVYEEKPSGYQGANRVWDELNDPNNAYVQSMLQNNGTSTTQGSGSCYIFYPQSLEDQQQSINLLAAMRVAFVDENGTLLETAYMDTQNVVEDAGRVIVPLRLRTSDSPVVDENGVTIDQYITPLMKNEARRISAIVYLEGDFLKNSEVLAAGSITGQMNIQFGTTEVKMDAVDDDATMREYLTFDFSLDGNRDGTAELTKEYEIPSGAPRIVDLYLDLGDAVSPKSVEGNFIAVINATQGARQQVFTMFRNENTGLWEAYHYVPNEDPKEEGTYVKGIPFSGPGNFQLRSIRVDGVDYLLNDQQMVKVKIPGMVVSALTWRDSMTNEKYCRTAESQWQEHLTLKLEASDGRAHKVQGIFLGNNGKNVTVNFSSLDNVYYDGVANFSAGGNYRLTYVYVDGELVPLEEDMYKQIELQLGLQVEITYTAPKIVESELQIPDGLTEEERQAYVDAILKDVVATPKTCYFRYNRLAPLEMEIECKIYDDQNHELRELNLPNPALYFGSASNGLDTDLVWDADKECYKGKFLITKNGIYTFTSLVLDDGSAITKAVSSPTITSASPDPVVYVHNMNAYPAFSNGLKDAGITRALQFKLKNSQGAAIKVLLSDKVTQNGVATVDETEEELQYITVSNQDGWDNKGILWSETQPDSNGVVTYTLTLPNDGYWEIVGLYLGGGVYYGKDEAGNDKMWSGETDADWADLSTLVQTDNIESYFLTEITISTSGMPITTRALYTEFMQRVTGENVYTPKIEVTNGVNGRPLAQVLQEVAELFPEEGINPSVEMSFSYTYTKNAAAWNIISGSHDPLSTISGAMNEDGAFVMNAAFVIEGNYEPHFTLKIGGEPYTGTIPAALQSIAESTVKMRWNLPTVTIGSVYPAAGTSFTTLVSASTSAEKVTVSNVATDKFAIVYPGHTGTSGQRWTLPTVTVDLKSGPAFKTAQIVGHHENGSAAAYPVTFDLSSGSATATFGSQTGNGVPQITVYGKQVFDKIVFTTNDGTTYSIPLANGGIMINNPQVPPAVTFAVAEGSPSIPSKIYATVNPDGTFSVTLPTLETWNDENSTTTTGAETVKSGPTTSNYYETWPGTGCDNGKTFYQAYRKTVTNLEQIETTVTNVRTYNILGWKLGDQMYTPGQTISITENMTLTAQLTYTDKDPVVTRVLLSFTRTEYYRGPDNQESQPAGEPIASDSDLVKEIDEAVGSGSSAKTATVESERVRTPLD